MKIDPIPIELLTDSVTLLTPTDSGYSGTVLGNVRVIRTSTVTDHLVTHTRDRSGVFRLRELHPNGDRI